VKVAIGPVFDEYGGVSQHIFGIKKYSSHNINVVPSNFNRSIIGKNELRKRAYVKLMDKIHISRTDIVHSHVDPWFTNLCIASRTSTCKWVHTYHTLYFEEDYPDGLQEWQKQINRSLIENASKADVRISISKWLHDHLEEEYSIQTEIVPNGVDLEACNKADPNRFIEKYGLKDFVLFVGSIQHIKNPKLFIELAFRMPEFIFLMIGRGLDPNNVKRECGINIPRNIILMKEMSHQDVLDAIAACKAFVMTSKREGIPTVLLEAMGLGKAVVVPDHSGCQEVVYSNDYGFLYRQDSIDDLVEMTKAALISKSVGKKARERIVEKYDWKVLAKEIDKVYESC
jgi:glycosyltransferase involved in cell wall biosynthesis